MTDRDPREKLREVIAKYERNEAATLEWAREEQRRRDEVQGLIDAFLAAMRQADEPGLASMEIRKLASQTREPILRKSIRLFNLPADGTARHQGWLVREPREIVYDSEDGVFISKHGELWRCVFDRRGLVGLHRWFPQPEPALATYSEPYPPDVAEMLGDTLACHRVAP